MLSFRTAGFNGYAAKYSPFYDNKLAVATSSNYGLVGNGRLYILNISANGEIVQENFFDTQDGLFDLSWSEVHENHVITANGDGSIFLFDATLQKFPIKKFKEHKREVFSVNWNLIDKTIFCSSSWDSTIKIWSPNRNDSILTLLNINNEQQNQCIYQAKFSPHDSNTLISCSSNSNLQTWDIRSPKPLQMDFIAQHGMECLSCDWNKYRPTIIATAGVDKSINIWDLRMIRTGNPINELLGHEFAIRNVTWSPHYSDKILSCSYDMTARIWSDKTDQNLPGINRRFNHGSENIFSLHKEFVIGGDWCLWGDPGWAVTVGWDEMVYVWDTKRT
ncbi:hypothetical protein PACTADRAFT_3365 [Pachysolen tannophilus NRRL Y-2460]|uniref:Peroxin-7 n=1 Tax=Pachysolen tannophilus NRRL Y-2460 TaxID=669874 RepID=A0A1E4TVB4_PACTA|nr:hypothetical protein PACTADRAFT_3365 [Pachysolen tannophilus NRRL Y-2460]